MIFGFCTLGCKVNQYETQALEQLLLARGHETGSFQEDCDGYIINTCSVTAVADKKNRAVIRRCRREHPEAIIGVCGCYSQHAPQILRDMGVDVLGGSGDREAFLEEMLTALETRQHREVLDNALKRRSFEILPAGGLEGRTRGQNWKNCPPCMKTGTRPVSGKSGCAPTISTSPPPCLWDLKNGCLKPSK